MEIFVPKTPKQGFKPVGETPVFKRTWTITRFGSDREYELGIPYDVSKIDGNLLLNDGKDLLIDLMIGDSAIHFTQANSSIAIGTDFATAENATQTGLIAEVTKKAVDSGYPLRPGTPGLVRWRVTFGTSEANHQWREFAVVNTGDVSDVYFNRKIDNQGEKVAGQTWQLDFEIQF